MTSHRADPRRIELWMDMAEHFLDTETRPHIPLTALRCVEAGLTPSQARDVWRYEVTPAVAFNLWDVAGEWAAWDRDWLIQRIERLRAGWWSRPGTLRALRHRVRAQCLEGVWCAIERCMLTLTEAANCEERARLAADLALLSGHYFDFCQQELATLPGATRRRVRALYPEPFRQAMAPALVPGEAKGADARVRTALQEGLP